MSDAKMVEAETRMQAEDLAKAEASVLIISISTKTRIGLFPLLSNKNLCPASNFFPGPSPPSRRTGLLHATAPGRGLLKQTNFRQARAYSAWQCYRPEN